MSSVAVVGPGSVGTFLAAHLAAIGHDVVACARTPFDRYVVDSPESPVTGPAHVVTTPSALAGQVDWLLLCVKAHQTAGAAEWLQHACGPHTTVVVVQNGIEGAELARPWCNGAEVIASVVYCSAELVAPGHIEHFTRGQLVVPPCDASSRLVELCGGSKVKVTVSPDFTTELWRKLGVNVVANGLTALTLRRMDVLRRDDLSALASRLLREAWAVGAAEGAALTGDDADDYVAAITRGPLKGGTSMLYDRQAGRRTEHDAIYGAVVRAAERHGLEVPHVRTIAALLAAADPPSS
jgi:2-dehydropantoate 2-reductase